MKWIKNNLSLINFILCILAMVGAGYVANLLIQQNTLLRMQNEQNKVLILKTVEIADKVIECDR